MRVPYDQGAAAESQLRCITDGLSAVTVITQLNPMSGQLVRAEAIAENANEIWRVEQQALATLTNSRRRNRIRAEGA